MEWSPQRTTNEPAGPAVAAKDGRCSQIYRSSDRCGGSVRSRKIAARKYDTGHPISGTPNPGLSRPLRGRDFFYLWVENAREGVTTMKQAALGTRYWLAGAVIAGLVSAGTLGIGSMALGQDQSAATAKDVIFARKILMVSIGENMDE